MKLLIILFIGYTRDHPYCFTIFSSSNYWRSNSAAVLKLEPNDNFFQTYTFKTNDFEKDPIYEKKIEILKKLKSRLYSEKYNLLNKFKNYDLNTTGKYLLLKNNKK